MSQTTLQIEHKSPNVNWGHTLQGAREAIERLRRMGVPEHARLHFQHFDVWAEWSTPAHEEVMGDRK